MIRDSSEPTARVLIVEDEPTLQESLVNFLHLEGIAANGVGSLQDAEAWIAKNDFDVLLLDLGLPDGDGLDWLQQRQDLLDKGLIITSARSDAISRISGIRAGADVYLVKPVLLEEVTSLVHNLIRRLQGSASSSWLLDETSWRLLAPNGRPLKLTHSEHLLLRRLAQSFGQAVSREDLVISLGHKPENYDFRRLEILVRRLRNKAKDLRGIALPLETAHRFGYAFTANLQIGTSTQN